jgi:amino-acid N-acetyltransferase
LRNYPEPSIEEEEFDLSSESPDPVLIREAKLSDIPAVLRLINGYAAKAVMLPRTELEICERLKDFLVAIEGDRLIGCAALQFYTQHMAELRSLAVVPEDARTGVGGQLTRAIMDEARRIGVDIVFAFTYVPGFFEKMGFRLVDRGALPLKAWKDCVRCPKFHACDEIAMAYTVTPGAEVYMSALPPEEAVAEEAILFPILGIPRILEKI